MYICIYVYMYIYLYIYINVTLSQYIPKANVKVELSHIYYHK